MVGTRDGVDARWWRREVVWWKRMPRERTRTRYAFAKYVSKVERSRLGILSTYLGWEVDAPPSQPFSFNLHIVVVGGGPETT